MDAVLGGGAAPEETTQPVETPQDTPQETPQESTSWYTGEEYKELASKYETPDQLLKDYENAQSLIGKKGIIKPGEEATEDDWNNYYKELGRPDEAKDYTLNDLENAPEWFGDTADTFRDLAHQAGLSQSQASKLFDTYVENQLGIEQNLIQESKAAHEQCMGDLKDAYGADATRMIQLANQVASESGIVDTLKVSNLANDAKMVSLLADYAKLKGMSSKPGVVENDYTTGKTIDDKMKEIRNNPEYGTDSPEGKRLNDEINQLINRKIKGFK